MILKYRTKRLIEGQWYYELVRAGSVDEAKAIADRSGSVYVGRVSGEHPSAKQTLQFILDERLVTCQMGQIGVASDANERLHDFMESSQPYAPNGLPDISSADLANPFQDTRHSDEAQRAAAALLFALPPAKDYTDDCMGKVMEALPDAVSETVKNALFNAMSTRETFIAALRHGMQLPEDYEE